MADNRLLTIADLRAYFEALGAAHPDIVQVIWGDADRITNKQRSTVRYPLLFVESPDVRFNTQTGRLRPQYSTQITVMDMPDTEAYAEIDARQDKTSRILMELLATIANDADRGKFDMNPSKLNAEFLGQWSGDKDVGWRTPITIGSVKNVCPPAQ